MSLASEPDKPKYILYTGTEQPEEKEILRNIFNSNWDSLPIGLRQEILDLNIGTNNYMGELIKVIMITASGAEGISLSNVRYVHITEPYWHPVRINQVIGRARRICSHKNLPKEFQTVEVFIYLMEFTDAQLQDEKAVELKLHDKSKVNPKMYLTSDQALFEINKKLPDLAIIDIKLDKTDKDGIDLLKLVTKKDKLTPVIMISGHATVQIAVEATRLGAYEFIEKPFSKEKILNYVKRALESSQLKKEKNIIENKLFHSFDLIGKSPAIIKVKKIVEKLSTSESRVLISGSTGTGKELVARKIHKNSSRAKEPFVIVNAALLKENTYEKELFGEEFEDGNVSFGALERANKGTLLIDEVSEIPYETQANVLRVLIDQQLVHKELPSFRWVNTLFNCIRWRHRMVLR